MFNTEDEDDHFHRSTDADVGDGGSTDRRSLVVRVSLRAWDIFAYVIGMCVRLQTIFLGVLLFSVETDHVCVASDESTRPIPLKYLPENLDLLPGSFHNMSGVF